MALRAVVVGAGWAGEGHTIGLRDAGVEVVALCARTLEPTRAKAAQLGVPEARSDWRSALDEFRPDIVSIATTGDAHRAIAEHAAELGCQIVCDKPLATSAADARAMLEAATRAGVKTAYAATGCYSPAVLQAQQLVSAGAIGRVTALESSLHFFIPNDLPLCWFHERARGGGMLSSIFAHKLAQVLRITGGKVVAASGVTRPFLDRVPVGPVVHDIRELFGPIPGWDPSQATEWREADADAEYTVTVDLRLPDGGAAQAVFRGAMGHYPHPDCLVINGTSGALHMIGEHGAEDHVRSFDRQRGEWEDLAVPDAITAALPPEEEGVQRCWNQLFREFTADLRGEGNAGYPTFQDGLVAMEVIEAALTQRPWVAQAQAHTA
jgi:predicted dehydrogenase